MQKSLEKRKIIPKFKLLSPIAPHRQTPDHSRSSRERIDRNAQLAKAYSPRSQADRSQFSPALSPSITNSLQIDDPFDFRPEQFENPFHEIHSTSSRIRNLEQSLEKTKQTYENQINYMQEYINFLKKKLGIPKSPENLETEFSTNPDQTLIIKNLKSEIENLNQIIASKDHDVNNYLEELCEKQNQIMYLQERIEKIEGGGERFWNKNFGSNESTVNNEREIKMFYEKQIMELESECASLRMEIKGKNHEIEYLQNEGKDYKSQALLRSLKSLETKLSEKVRWVSENQEQQIKRLNEKLSLSDKKVDSLTKTLNFIQANSAANRSQKVSIEKFEDHLSDKNLLIENLKNSLSKATAEIETINIKMKDLKTESNSLEHLLENEKSTNEKLQKRIHELIEDLSNEKKWKFDKLQENTRIKEASQEFESLIAEKNNEISKNLANIDLLKNALNKKHEEIMKKDRQIQDLMVQSHEITRLKQLFEEKQGTISKETIEKSSQIEDLKNQLSEKSKKIDKLNKIILEQNSETKKLHEQNQQINFELSILNTTKKELENSLESKQGKIQDFHDNLQQQKLKIDQLSKLITETDEKLQTSIQDNKNLNTIVYEKESIITELEKTVTNQSNNIEKLIQSNKSYLEKLKNNNEIIKNYEKKDAEQMKFLTGLENKVKSLEKELANSFEGLNNMNEVMKKDGIRYEAMINEAKQENIELQENFNMVTQQKDKDKEAFHEALAEKERIFNDLLTELEQEKAFNENITLDYKSFKLKHIESETNQAKTVLALNEVINTHKANEGKLKKELSDLMVYNKELKGKVDKIDLEIAKAYNENMYLREKIDELQSYHTKYQDKNTKNVEDLENKVRELEFYKKKSEEERDRDKNEFIGEMKKAKNTENELMMRIGQMEVELGDFVEENRRKNEVANEKDAEIYRQRLSFTQEVNELKSKIREKESDMVAANENLADFHEQIKENKEKIDLLLDKIKQKDCQIEVLESKIDKKCRKLQTLKKDHENVNNTLYTSSENLLSKESAILSLTNTISDLQSSINDMIEAKDQDKNNHLAELAAKDNKISQKTSQINILQNSLEKLQLDIKELKLKALDAENGLRNEVYEVKDQKELLLSQKKSLTRENTLLAQNIGEMKVKIQHFDSEISKACEENLELRRKIEDNDNRFVMWKNKQELVVKEMEAEKESLIKIIDEVKNNGECEVKNAVKAVENREEIIKNLDEEIEEYRDKIQSLNMAISKNQIKREKSKQKKKDMQEQFNQQLSVLQSEIQSKESELSASSEAKNLLSLEITKLQKEKLLLEDKIKDLNLQTSNLQSSLITSNEEISNLKEQIRKLNYSIQDEVNKSSLSTSKIHQLEDQNEDLLTKIADLKQAISKSSEDSEAEISILKCKLSSQNQEIQDLKSQLENAKNEAKLVKMQGNETESYYIKINSELTDEIKSGKFSELKLKKDLQDLSVLYEEAKSRMARVDEKVTKICDENRVLRLKMEETRKNNLDVTTEQANIIMENAKKIESLQNALFESKQALEEFEGKHNKYVMTTDEHLHDLTARLREFQDDLKMADEELSEKNNEIMNLKQIRAKLESENKVCNQKMSLINQENTQKEILLKELESQFNTYKDSYEKECEMTENLKNFSEGLTQKNREMEKELAWYGEDKKESTEMIKNLEGLIEKEQLEFENTLSKKDKEMEELEKRITEDYYKIEELSNQIKEIKTSYIETETSLIEENIELKNTLKNSKIQIEEQHLEISSLNDKIKENQSKISNLNTLTTSLQNSINILESTNKALSIEKTSHVTESSLQLLDLNGKLEHLSKQNQDLESQKLNLINKQETEKSYYESELSKLNLIIINLKNAHQQESKKVSDAYDDNNSLKQEIDKLKKRNDDIMSVLNTKDSDVNKILKEKDIELRKMGHYKEELETKVQNLMSLNLSLNEKIVENDEIIAGFKEEVLKLNQFHKDYEEKMLLDLAKAYEIKEDLRQKNAEIEKLTLANCEIGEVLKELEEQNKNISGQNRYLQESLEKQNVYINSLENAVKAATEKGKNLEKTLEKKEKLVISYEETADELNRAVGELKKYQKTVQNYEETIKKYEVSIQNSEETIQNLQNSLKTLESQQESYIKEIKSLQNTVEGLKNHSQSLLKTIETNQESLSSKDISHQNTQKQLESALSSIQTLQETLQKSEDKTSKLEKINEGLRKTIFSTEQQVKYYKNENESLSKSNQNKAFTIENLQKEVKDKTQDIILLEAELKTAKKHVLDKDGDNKEIMKLLLEKEKRQAEDKVVIEELSGRVVKLEEINKEIMEKGRIFEGVILENKGRIKEFEVEIKKYKEKIRTMEKEMENVAKNKEKIEKELIKAQKKCQEQNDEIDKIQGKFAETQGELDKIIIIKEQAQNELKEHIESINTHKNINEQKGEKIEEQAEIIKNLQAKIKVVEEKTLVSDRNADGAKKNLAIAERQAKKAQEQIENLKSKIEGNDKKIRELEDAVKENEVNIKENVKVIKNKDEVIKSLEEQLESSHDGLQISESVLQQSQNSLSESLLEIETLKSQLSQEQKSSTDLKSRLESYTKEKDSLLKRSETLKSSFDEERKKSTSLERKVTQITKSNTKDIESLKKELEQKDQLLQSESNEKSELQEALNSVSSEKTSLQMQIKDAETKIKQLEKTLENLRITNESNIKQLKSAQEEIRSRPETPQGDLAVKIQDLEMSNARLKEENLALNKDMNTLQINMKKEKGKFEAIIADKDKRFTQQTNKMQFNADELSNKRKEIEKKNDEIFANKGEIQRLMKEINDLKQGKSNEANKTIQQENQKLKLEVERLQKSEQNAMQNDESLNNTVKELNETIQELREKIAEHEKNCPNPDKDSIIKLLQSQKIKNPEYEAFSYSIYIWWLCKHKIGNAANDNWLPIQSRQAVTLTILSPLIKSENYLKYFFNKAKLETRRLSRTLTAFRGNRAREKEEFSSINEKNAQEIKSLSELVENLRQENTQVVKQFEEKVAVLRNLSKLNVNTYDGRKKIQEILSGVN